MQGTETQVPGSPSSYRLGEETLRGSVTCSKFPISKRWNSDSNLDRQQRLVLTTLILFLNTPALVIFMKNLITTGCKNTYHHCNEWFLELLIEHLSTNINPRKPAAIARVAMIPANCVFKAANLTNEEGTGV